MLASRPEFQEPVPMLPGEEEQLEQSRMLAAAPGIQPHPPTNTPSKPPRPHPGGPTAASTPKPPVQRQLDMVPERENVEQVEVLILEEYFRLIWIADGKNFTAVIAKRTSWTSISISNAHINCTYT